MSRDKIASDGITTTERRREIIVPDDDVIVEQDSPPGSTSASPFSSPSVHDTSLSSVRSSDSDDEENPKKLRHAYQPQLSSMDDSGIMVCSTMPAYNYNLAANRLFLRILGEAYVKQDELFSSFKGKNKEPDSCNLLQGGLREASATITFRLNENIQSGKIFSLPQKKKPNDQSIYLDSAGNKLVQSFDRTTHQLTFAAASQQDDVFISIQRQVINNGKCELIPGQFDHIYFSNGKISHVVLAFPIPTRENCRIFDHAVDFLKQKDATLKNVDFNDQTVIEGVWNVFYKRASNIYPETDLAREAFRSTRQHSRSITNNSIITDDDRQRSPFYIPDTSKRLHSMVPATHVGTLEKQRLATDVTSRSYGRS